MRDHALEAAYQNTTYVVDHAEGEIAIRLGESCAQLDAMLSAHRVTAWAYISACNPHSQRVSPVENAARHARLIAQVRSLGLTVLSGRGKPDRGDWAPEESLLILGLAEDAAVALGTAFAQNAVMVGTVGGVAELRWCI